MLLSTSLTRVIPSQLAAGHSKILESIVDTFEQIERALPRFQCYVEDYVSPSSTITHLRDAIRRYYQELIDQCQDYIRFLKASPFSTYFIVFRDLHNKVLYNYAGGIIWPISRLDHRP